MTADQARDKAMKLLVAIHEGIDPQAEKTDRRAAITVSALIAAFMSQHVEVHCRGGTIEAHRSALEHLTRADGNLKAVSVRRQRL
jgi:hypothetical protein